MTVCARRVVLAELGVGLAVRGLQRVGVDDVGLEPGLPRRVDQLSPERLGVVGDGDLLRGEVAGNRPPGHATGDDEDDPEDDRQQSQHADRLRAPRGRGRRHVSPSEPPTDGPEPRGPGRPRTTHDKASNDFTVVTGDLDEYGESPPVLRRARGPWPGGTPPRRRPSTSSHPNGGRTTRLCASIPSSSRPSRARWTTASVISASSDTSRPSMPSSTNSAMPVPRRATTASPAVRASSAAMPNASSSAGARNTSDVDVGGPHLRPGQPPAQVHDVLQTLTRHGRRDPALRGPGPDDRQPQPVRWQAPGRLADQLDQRDRTLAGCQAHGRHQPQRPALTGPAATLGERRRCPQVEVDPVGHHGHVGAEHLPHACGRGVADGAEGGGRVAASGCGGRACAGRRRRRPACSAR